ncbi:MAG: hypothetical protein P8X43_04835, partial [Maritimibacter sp.]
AGKSEFRGAMRAGHSVDWLPITRFLLPRHIGSLFLSPAQLPRPVTGEGMWAKPRETPAIRF